MLTLLATLLNARVTRALLFTAALLGGAQANAASISIDGHLPRNLANGNFQLTITIKSISALEYAAGQGDLSSDDLKFQHRLQVFFVGNGYSATTALPYTAAGATTSPMLYWVSRNSATQVQSPTDGTWIFTYIVDLNAGTGNALQLATNNGNTLAVGANFYLNATGIQTQAIATTSTSGVAITQTAGIGKDTPSFAPSAPIIGSMNTISVAWTPPAGDQIATIQTNSTVGSADAGSVIAYTFDDTVGTTPLPTLTYAPSASSTTPDITGTHCTYTPPLASQVSSTCITCDDATSLYYLNKAEMLKLPGIRISSAQAKGGSATVSSLINGKPYVVFLQYDYPSIVPSGGQQCLIGRPSPNYTMTEINGEAVGKIVDFRCFIATAAYGSPMHKDLRLFRKFRDRILLKSAVGRTFVHYYYRFSPPLADFIAEHPVLRTMTRGILAIPAEILRETDASY